MTLTREDVKRISDLGHSSSDYLVKTSDGFCQLRNVDGNCYFYDAENGICTIYDARPDGCRFYPIIYDMKKRKCVADVDCPSRVTVSRQEIRKVTHRVKALVMKLREEAKHNERPC
jgi:Fe-S-cluster containining protein